MLTPRAHRQGHIAQNRCAVGPTPRARTSSGLVAIRARHHPPHHLPLRAREAGHVPLEFMGCPKRVAVQVLCVQDAATTCGWLQKKPQTCAPRSCCEISVRPYAPKPIWRAACLGANLGKLALWPTLPACLDGLLDQHHVEHLGHGRPSGLRRASSGKCSPCRHWCRQGVPLECDDGTAHFRVASSSSGQGASAGRTFARAAPALRRRRCRQRQRRGSRGWSRCIASS
jgi:hypothetical protein